MKILQLIQKPQLRGAEVFASQLSSHLNKNGHDVIIVPIFNGTADLPFDGVIIPLHGVQKKKYWDIKAWKRLAQIVNEQNPDVVQANAGDTLQYAVFSKMIYGWNKPIVFRNASTISLYIKKRIAKKWFGFFFSKAERIISVSKASAADFESIYPKLKNRIVHIPIGIETESLTESIVEKEIIENENSAPKLLHVGGFSFEKNHKGLIEIFEKLLQKSPHATLHLVGGGLLKTDIEALVKQKGLENQVIFHGFQKDPLQFIRNSDVLLLPSIIEGLPGVILEAFYCKTPVVAYDVGGIKEVVINNKTGRLVSKGNVDVFVDYVMQALVKDNSNQKIIQNAFELVTEKYLNTQIANRFLSVYQDIVPSKNNVPEIHN